MMSERTFLSIGDVLNLLKSDFPDITISKIRFLESQGLLDPERTPSGYRKFYEDDVDKLRWILRQQRENFLPLKVIKGKLHGVPEEVNDKVIQPRLDFTGSATDTVASQSGVLVDESRDETLAVRTIKEQVTEPSFKSPKEPYASLTRQNGPLLAPRNSQQDSKLETSRNMEFSAIEQERKTVAEAEVHASTARQSVIVNPTKHATKVVDIAGDTDIPSPATADRDGHAVTREDRNLPISTPVGNTATVSNTAPASRSGPAGNTATVSKTATVSNSGPEGNTAPVSNSGPAGNTATVSNTAPVSNSGPAGNTAPKKPPQTTQDLRQAREALGLATPPAGKDASESRQALGLTGPPTSKDLSHSGQADDPNPTTKANMQDNISRQGLGISPDKGEIEQTKSSQSAADDPEEDVNLTLSELANAAGLHSSAIEELMQYGLISGSVVAGTTFFTQDALTVARLAAGFSKYGIDPRHIRIYKLAAEREVGLFEQVVVPILKQRNPDAKRQARQSLVELSRLGQQMRTAMVRAVLNSLDKG